MKEEQTSVKARHEVERLFHDRKATAEHKSENGNFYAAGGIDLVWRSYLARVGHLQGKRVLDFGCGEGWSTMEYVRRGAVLYSFDISLESVRKLMRAVDTVEPSRKIYPAIMAAEYLGYPPNTFDLVLGVAILHHTDLEYIGPEVARVLKPGGRALFMEPLAHNWLLRIFRALTPQRRTPTERPMTVKQIMNFGRCFGRVEFQAFYLFSIFPQGLLWATGSRRLFHWTLRVTEAVDRWLLKVCPFLQRYCWSAIIEVQK